MSEIKVTYKYTRKGFWGEREYTEDSVYCNFAEDASAAIKKAVKHMLSNSDSAVEVREYDGNKTIIVWQERIDKEMDVVTVRTFNPDVFTGWKDIQMSKQRMMKLFRELCEKLESLEK